MSKHHAAVPARTWARFRLQILARDGWRCRACGRAGGPFEVDHIIPLDRGGAALDPGNAQALCVPCHFKKTRAENTKPDPERAAWRAYMATLL